MCCASVLEDLDRYNCSPPILCADAPHAGRVEYGRSVGNWSAFEDSSGKLQYLTNYFKLVTLSNVDNETFQARPRNEKLISWWRTQSITNRSPNSIPCKQGNLQGILRFFRFWTGIAVMANLDSVRFSEQFPTRRAGKLISRAGGLTSQSRNPGKRRLMRSVVH